jgi:hypothetical protein
LTTRTDKTQKTSKTGSLDSTEPTPTTLPESKLENKLEREAVEFRASRKKVLTPPPKPGEVTSRIYLAGQAMNALLINSRGQARMGDVKHEAFGWADYFLRND